MLSEHSTIHITVKFPCKFKIIDSTKPKLLPQLKLNHWFPGGKSNIISETFASENLCGTIWENKNQKRNILISRELQWKARRKTENERWNSHLRLRATVKFFKNENTINHGSPAKELLCFLFFNHIFQDAFGHRCLCAITT